MKDNKKIFCELKVGAAGDVGFSTDNNNDTSEKQNHQTEWSKKWKNNTVTYAVIVKSNDAGIFSTLRKLVGLAFTTWEKEIPIDFKRVKKLQNPDITIEFVDDANADDYFKNNGNVLAYAYYPGTSKQGIIRFNDYRYEWGNSHTRKDGKRVYNTLHTLIHEIGHSIGLAHAEIKGNGNDVMDPIYHDQLDLSAFDIERIQKKYGKSKMSSRRYARFVKFLSFRKRNVK